MFKIKREMEQTLSDPYRWVNCTNYWAQNNKLHKEVVNNNIVYYYISISNKNIIMLDEFIKTNYKKPYDIIKK